MAYALDFGVFLKMFHLQRTKPAIFPEGPAAFGQVLNVLKPLGTLSVEGGAAATGHISRAIRTQFQLNPTSSSTKTLKFTNRRTRHGTKEMFYIMAFTKRNTKKFEKKKNTACCPPAMPVPFTIFTPGSCTARCARCHSVAISCAMAEKAAVAWRMVQRSFGDDGCVDDDKLDYITYNICSGNIQYIIYLYRINKMV